MQKKYRNRRIVGGVISATVIALAIFLNPASYERIYIDLGGDFEATATSNSDPNSPLASEILEKLEVKGRAPKTGYERTKFYDSWPVENGCNLR